MTIVTDTANNIVEERYLPLCVGPVEVLRGEEEGEYLKDTIVIDSIEIQITVRRASLSTRF